MNTLHTIEERIRAYLSHRPKFYALIAGIGIVLFWRGVWHSVDTIHLFIDHHYAASSIDTAQVIWWDGPLSFVVGIIILYFTGSFVSSFIGNELILSGLRGEKKLNQKTETEISTEKNTIAEIKEELSTITEKLDEVELEIIDKK